MPDPKTLLLQAQDLITQAINSLPQTPIQGTSSFYPKSCTDLVVRQKPIPLSLGAAPFAFKDPTYGTSMLRVTDDKTFNGGPAHLASSEHVPVWSADSKKFYILNQYNNPVVLTFDGVTVSNPQKIPNTSNVEPCFSRVNPDLIYSCYGSTPRIIKAYNLATASGTTILNLDTKFPNLTLANTVIGAFQVVDNDVYAVAFGGGAQDQHKYIYHSVAGFKDISSLCLIHALSMDRTGQYVMIYPRGADIIKVGSQVIMWDTTANTLTPVTKLYDGHDCVGYGDWINKSCCTSSSWDAFQWQYRKLSALTATKDIINSVLSPKQIFVDDHPNWGNASPTVLKPFFTALYRFDANSAGSTYDPTLDGTNQLVYPWRACDDEVLAIQPDNGLVSRFCHHQSIPGNEFWSQPIIFASPDGNYSVFHTNWGKILGSYVDNLNVSHLRQDVFLIHCE